MAPVKGNGPVDTVVFPVAGKGTRFLPVTQAVPKELLPVLNKPLIQYAVDEAVAAGARRLVFVSGAMSAVLRSYFSSAGKARAGSASPELCFVEQPEPKGLGDAILCAREAVSGERFGVILPDDLITAEPPGTLAAMAAIADAENAAMVAVEPVAAENVDRYGIVSVEDGDGRLLRVNGLVEKPAPARAPSRLGIVGRYMLPCRVFDILAETGPGSGGEVQLTDALVRLLDFQAVMSWRFSGVRFDCGNPAGLLQATFEYARTHPEFKATLEGLIARTRG